MSRRGLLKSAAAAGAAAAVSPVLGSELAPAGTPFRMKYAPHFGMFENSAGKDPVDQLKFAADEGFRAWEDNGMMGRSVAEQERIAKAMADLKIEMGVFVAHAEWGRPLYARGGAEARKELTDQMKRAVEVAKRVNAKWCTVVPGLYDMGLEYHYQLANCIDCLKAMAEVCEPAGLVMVLEPLNPYRDHPGLLLTKVPQGYVICKGVGSPSCKILDDLYHQQITEGNLIPNLDRSWDEIAYFQIGDNPGRQEPLTGEINYRNIFGHLHRKGYKGILGMEHGKSQGGVEGEKKLIAAYRFCDAF